MFLGLKPLEFVWLLVALTIVGQQLIVRKGAFDPTAFAAVAFFVGLIPAGRADKRKTGQDSAEAPISKLREKLADLLRPGEPPKGPED